MTRYVIENKAPGARMILTGTGTNVTFEKGAKLGFELTDEELEAGRPYFDSGELTYRPAGPDDEALFPPPTAPVQRNATPSSDGATVVLRDGTEELIGTAQLASGVELDNPDLEDEGKDVTHVKHLGFGRWFGMKGDEKVTEAMTRAEAEAFAQEHNVPLGEEPDPSADDGAEADEGEAEETASPPDET
jgi:hypothetical protein